MPTVPFCIYLYQMDNDRKASVLRTVPYTGALMTVLAFALKPWSLFRTYFYNGVRMTGFFQYANTFAMYLLVGIILILFVQRVKVFHIGILLVLLFGIFQSGSRTVFVLTVLMVAAISIYRKEVRKTALIGFGAVLVCVVAFILITKKYEGVGRFLTTSLTQSSLVGRILYYKDAIPVIIKHPFGLGYLGYFYAQSEFQTGRYIVRFIHNDFLQIILDVGIVPGMLFIAAVLKNFFSKQTPVFCRFIIIAISMHCMLDFDLQYLSIFFILIAAMNFDSCKEKTIKKYERKTFCFFSAVKAIICVYFCVALGFYSFGYSDISYKMFSNNTNIELEMLRNARTQKELSSVATKILSHNKNVALAYDALAKVAQLNGKYDQMIENKMNAINVAKFNVNEYLDYFRLLESCINDPDENRTEEKEMCIKHIKEIPALMQSVMNGADPLAWKIEETPNLALTDDMIEYLEQLE